MKLTQTNSFTKESLLFYISLGRISFLNFQEKLFLLKNIDSSNALALLSIEDIENLVNRKFSKRVIWDGKKNLLMAEAILSRCQKLNIEIIFYFEDSYPPLLKEISDPPFLMYCRGNSDLLKSSGVSVVGTRRLTQNGKQAAVDFAYDAILSGSNVISGLANGADGYAHQGAINAYFDCKEHNFGLDKIGRTIAVLPSAIDEIVPYNHKKLAAQIIQTGGLLVSEFEPGTITEKWHFVARNRIIAALSTATVVIEAPSGSGALITADFALEYNRDVFFHEVAFSHNAVQIDSIVKSDLEKKHAEGTVSKYKLENSIKKFIDNGAPVIKDYEDFCKVQIMPPGEKNKQENKNPPCIQGELF